MGDTKKVIKGDTKKVIKRGRQRSMMEQQRLFSSVFNRTCDVTTSMSSSFFLFKIPYGISQSWGQMISFLKRKKGEEYRRGLGKMYWQQVISEIPSSSFFFFRIFFLPKAGQHPLFSRLSEGWRNLNCILIFFQFFSLFNRSGEIHLGRKNTWMGIVFLREKKEKGEDD